MPADSVLTLDDLAAWSQSGTALGVLGHPIAHSLSPIMHNAALQCLAAGDARLADWRYYKFDIPPERLAEALPLFHRHRFFGLNLTVPHKVLALDCIHHVDAEAAEIGAVNTLRWTTDGYEGFNTDGYGLTQALRDDLGVTLAGASVVLLGAGGASRGAALACLRAGCAHLWIGNRSPDRLTGLLALLREAAPGAAVTGFALATPPADIPPDAVIVNATASGLKPDDVPPISLASFPASAKLYDMIYNPPETALLREARARGMDAANGLSMLVHQGARALEIWTKHAVPAGVMREAARQSLASHR